MGFIKAFSGAIGGTFADQWKDFIVPRSDVSATAGVFGAERRGTDAGRGANTKGSENIITNGSKIVVPEGTALITMQDGAITGCITEPGGFTFTSDDQNSKSFFAGDGILSSTLTTSWERFKMGGVPGGEQLFNEVVGSLSAAFSNYTNDPSKGNRITKIQGDQIGFAKSLSTAVEEGYRWKSDRGLEIVKVAITAIEYDEDTKALLSDVKKADALSGARGNSFMQQSVARGFQAAGENGGGNGMAFMGMGVNAVGGAMGAFQQPVQNNTVQEDPYEKLTKMKQLLDNNVITQEEFDKAKKDLLG